MATNKFNTNLDDEVFLKRVEFNYTKKSGEKNRYVLYVDEENETYMKGKKPNGDYRTFIKSEMTNVREL